MLLQIKSASDLAVAKKKETPLLASDTVTYNATAVRKGIAVQYKVCTVLCKDRSKQHREKKTARKAL